MWQRLIFGRTTVIRPVPIGPFAGHHTIAALPLQVAPNVVLEGWVAEPLQPGPRKVLLYFGGRNENVVWAPKLCSHLGHWSVYAFNYRGMGGSGGRPTEANAKGDAQRILQLVLEREQHAAHIAVAGRSLGATTALSVCRPDTLPVAFATPVQQLVLLSPFDSLMSLLKGENQLRPLAWVARRHFDNVSLAAQVQVPTSIFLAEQDTRVPHAHSHRLARHLVALKEISVVEGTNHKTLPRHPATLKALAHCLNAFTHLN